MAKKKNEKPFLFEIPLDATDEQLSKLARDMRVAYFGYDPQESPDFKPSNVDYFKKMRESLNKQDEKKAG